jgi:hypothetical protein
MTTRFKNRLGLIALVAVLFASCTSTRIAALENKPGENLEIFMSKLPEKKYKEVAYLQCDGSIFHTPQHLLNGLKKKALSIKADALIQVKYDYQAWYPNASAVAIVYIE